MPIDYSKYPADWKLRSRFVRKIRAGDRCEWCDAANGQPHPITGSKVILTTAHVFDRRPEAAQLLNLAALCQRCHLGHDRRIRRRDQLRLDLGGRRTMKRARKHLRRAIVRQRLVEAQDAFTGWAKALREATNPEATA